MDKGGSWMNGLRMGLVPRIRQLEDREETLRLLLSGRILGILCLARRKASLVTRVYRWSTWAASRCILSSSVVVEHHICANHPILELTCTSARISLRLRALYVRCHRITGLRVDSGFALLKTTLKMFDVDINFKTVTL